MFRQMDLIRAWTGSRTEGIFDLGLPQPKAQEGLNDE